MKCRCESDGALVPHELRDLSTEPELAGQVEALRAELRRWQTELGDDQEGQGRLFWEGLAAGD